MKRILTPLLVVALALGMVACSSQPAKPAGDGAQPPTVATEPAAPDPYAVIPTDGAHERAALDAIPTALQGVAETNKSLKKKTPDITGATPTLFFYSLDAIVGKQLTMFEVRADGKAYGLYNYPAAPDPANLFWQSASGAAGAFLAAPEGPLETAAAAAVKTVMDQAKPGKAADIKMSGYTFCFTQGGALVKTAGGQVFMLTVDPKGNAASWSN